MDWTDDAIDQLYIDIGQRIRTARSSQSRNQAELGQDVGLTRSSIANIEAGRQKILAHTLLRIAESLNEPIASLLPNTSQMREIAHSARPLPSLTERLSGHSEETRDFVTSALRRAREGIDGSTEAVSD